MYGIDISEHNGNIDLVPYKGQFVIIRAGYGRSTVDRKFERNVNECLRLNIPFGVYWYSYALNTEHASQEAEKCLATIKPYKDNIRVGVWFDMEDADHYKSRNGFKFNRANVSAVCNAFCDVISAAGYYVGIYTSQSWLGTYVSCPKYDKWVANWGINNGGVNVDTSKLGTLLQYTSKPLDKDYMYVGLDTYNTKSKGKTYSGDLNIKLPGRKRFVLGDGYERLTKYQSEIKKVQRFLNWALDSEPALVIDGFYGEKTKAACLAFQKKAGMKNSRGNWGIKTQTKAKEYKR